MVLPDGLLEKDGAGFCTTCGDEEFRSIDGSAVGRKYIPAISIGAAVLIIGGIILLIVSKKKKVNH